MTSPPTCSCGMFAVGICLSCEEPFCSAHGRLTDGRFLCISDTAIEQEAERAEFIKNAQARSERFQDALPELIRHLHRVLETHKIPTIPLCDKVGEKTGLYGGRTNVYRKIGDAWPIEIGSVGGSSLFGDPAGRVSGIALDSSGSPVEGVVDFGQLRRKRGTRVFWKGSDGLHPASVASAVLSYLTDNGLPAPDGFWTP